MIAERFPLQTTSAAPRTVCLTVNQWKGNLWKLYLGTGIIKSGR